MFQGTAYFFTGLKILPKPGVRRFVIVPLFINIVIFSLVIWFGSQWFDRFLDKVLPGWLSWAEFVLWPLFALSYFLLLFYLFALLINVIAAPFNDLLSERVEQLLLGQKNLESASSASDFLKEIPRSIGNEISKLLYFLLRSLPLLIIFIIPGLQLFAPILWFIFSAWMLSLEYIDYPCSNHGILFKQTRSTVGSKRMTCLGFGATAAVFTMIPVINFIAMPAAVAGATVLYLKEFRQD